MMTTFKVVFFGAILVFVSALSHAESVNDEVDLRDIDEVGFENNNQGRIDSVDLNQRNIVINDWLYHLALDLKVYGKVGLETDFALKEGRSVKYEISPSSAGREESTITNIWILQD